MKKAISLFFALTIITLLLKITSATFISGEIYLTNEGNANFDVETDAPLNLSGLTFENNKLRGATPELLSFQKGTWTFTLNNGNYDTIFLDIYLPKNLESISSISGSDHIIDIDNKVVSIIDDGELNFRISYKTKSSTNLSWLVWPIIIILIILAYVLYKKSRKRKEHLNHVLPLVNEYEEKILNLLMKKPIRQKELRKTLDIPKASFSRYISNLEKKKLIVREGDGKNKIVSLK